MLLGIFLDFRFQDGGGEIMQYSEEADAYSCVHNIQLLADNHLVFDGLFCFEIKLQSVRNLDNKFLKLWKHQH